MAEFTAKERQVIGSEIASARQNRGISVRELANATGLSHGHIVRIQAGTTGYSLDALTRLVHALGISADRLAELVPRLKKEFAQPEHGVVASGRASTGQSGRFHPAVDGRYRLTIEVMVVGNQCVRLALGWEILLDDLERFHEMYGPNGKRKIPCTIPIVFPDLQLRDDDPIELGLGSSGWSLTSDLVGYQSIIAPSQSGERRVARLTVHPDPDTTSVLVGALSDRQIESVTFRVTKDEVGSLALRRRTIEGYTDYLANILDSYLEYKLEPPSQKHQYMLTWLGFED